MSSLIWLMLLSCSTLVISTKNASDGNTRQGKSIFILAGQSNMAGRGGIHAGVWDGYIPLECQSSPKVLRLNSEHKWEEARPPLHRDIDYLKACGIGPGLAFANSVLQKNISIGDIGLVPCAVGGTQISEWRRGSPLYKQLLSRAHAALHDGGIIRAILWYQGESDTLSQEDAKLYKMRLAKLFTDIRSDMKLPKLPVILVALASAEGPYIDEVRKAQLGLDLPNVKCVDAKGMEIGNDGLHLSTKGEVKVGQMMADAFTQFMA
ncbi:probable carbohydrate esterase At4g34215 [Sesamum indicum]|uniref:Probable carbohydrate esterase At4g34215 n=1 Tax=Sesamum indicum TaxID=4182 RepID=A0A6I9TFK1_SESIN|nr:probable carbohydrate esterase At4g34215 [Sesamum indicum]